MFATVLQLAGLVLFVAGLTVAGAVAGGIWGGAAGTSTGVGVVFVYLGLAMERGE